MEDKVFEGRQQQPHSILPAPIPSRQMMEETLAGAQLMNLGQALAEAKSSFAGNDHPLEIAPKAVLRSAREEVTTPQKLPG
jgi:hypothetical protein